jgi:hypothetical protein
MWLEKIPPETAAKFWQADKSEVRKKRPIKINSKNILIYIPDINNAY